MFTFVCCGGLNSIGGGVVGGGGSSSSSPRIGASVASLWSHHRSGLPGGCGVCTGTGICSLVCGQHN